MIANAVPKLDHSVTGISLIGGGNNGGPALADAARAHKIMDKPSRLFLYSLAPGASLGYKPPTWAFCSASRRLSARTTL